MGISVIMDTRSNETALGIPLVSIKVKSGESSIETAIAMRNGTRRSEEAFKRAKTINSAAKKIKS